MLATLDGVRILVTNDDGIDSVGLHVLARTLRQHGDVVIGAPDSEYSGASAAFGALHLMRPELHTAHVDGIDEAWSISGPPALCVMFARMGAFGDPFDLVVSGINPGANVGRAVYHSGTVGAAITARNGGITGVAISQAVSEGGYMGQGMEEMLANQQWQGAADVAAHAVGRLVEDMPAEAGVLNLNVPNCAAAEMLGWVDAEIAMLPIRAMSTVEREPKIGHEGAYHLKVNWGERGDMPPESTDVGAVQRGYVASTWLSKLHPVDAPELPGGGTVLDGLFP